MSRVSAADLTLEEKAALTSGESFWTTTPLERVGVPSIMLTDGPHGLRKQAEAGDHLGMGASVPATCFPPAVGLGSSWDVDLLERVGAALGAEASIEDVAVLLGPGVNIKRSPLCGRNFEYFSEDPVVAGVLGAAIVRGIQSQGVGASLKHFAANNQETDRMRVSADIDPRPLREIYLRGFERVVRDAQPWTVMCAYNRINGVYASEDPWLLTRVLRDEWGFDGVVVSDWGAVNDRVRGLPAGLDLEMPSSNGATDRELVEAVRAGRLEEASVELAAQRVLDLVDKAREGAGRVAGPLDVDAHHALAREAAGRSIVLLRNEAAEPGGAPLLPLRSAQRLAVVGAFAETPRYQGAGSSMIRPMRLDDALTALREQAPDLAYARGFSLAEGASDAEQRALRDEAVAVAAEADVTVVFLGLPARIESEGYDRADIDLPADQLALLDAVLEATSRVVVVLSNGGVVALPFAERVPAIVEAWLLGQAGGTATADVLFGAVSPSGKLTETIPLRLADTPAALAFPGEHGHVRYGEGLFVGYRWYDARDLDVAFPFGHGLSYTAFAYGAVSAAPVSAAPDADVVVSVEVTNTGAVGGREIVQVYTSLAGTDVSRPRRELKAFASVALEPGETRTVELIVHRADLAVWDIRLDRWRVEGGDYTLEIGASSRDVRATTTVEVAGDGVRIPLTRESSLGDALADPIAGSILREAISEALEGMSGVAEVLPDGIDPTAMMTSLPLGRLSMMTGDAATAARIDELIARANEEGARAGSGPA